MANKFEINPLDKISSIPKQGVREICCIAVTTAREHMHRLRSAAINEVSNQVLQKLPSIIKGD